MTDLEKTIDDLTLMNALCHGTVFDDAIALLKGLQDEIDRSRSFLKEQEAVKPLPQNSNGWVRTITLWYCGACHAKISRRTSKYCPNCGRSVKWE